MPWAAQGPQERSQTLTQASSVVGALPLPCAHMPFEVTGLILVPAAHSPLEVAGQRWPERGDSGEGVGIRHRKRKWVPQMSLFLCSPAPLPRFTPCRCPGTGCVLSPGLRASAPWSCPWAGDRVTVTRQPPWDHYPSLQAGGQGPLLPTAVLPAHALLAVPVAPGGTMSRWHCTNVTLSITALSESCRSTSPSSSTWGQRGGGSEPRVPGSTGTALPAANQAGPCAPGRTWKGRVLSPSGTWTRPLAVPLCPCMCQARWVVPMV